MMCRHKDNMRVQERCFSVSPSRLSVRTTMWLCVAVCYVSASWFISCGCATTCKYMVHVCRWLRSHACVPRGACGCVLGLFHPAVDRRRHLIPQTCSRCHLATVVPPVRNWRAHLSGSQSTGSNTRRLRSVVNDALPPLNTDSVCCCGTLNVCEDSVLSPSYICFLLFKIAGYLRSMRATWRGISK